MCDNRVFFYMLEFSHYQKPRKPTRVPWSTHLGLQRAPGCQEQFNAAWWAMGQCESQELLSSGQVLVAFCLSQLAADIPALRVTCKTRTTAKE